MIVRNCTYQFLYKYITIDQAKINDWLIIIRKLEHFNGKIIK